MTGTPPGVARVHSQLLFMSICFLGCEADVTMLDPETSSVIAAPALPQPASDAAPPRDLGRCDDMTCAGELPGPRPREACDGAETLKPAGDGERTLLAVSGSNLQAADTSQSPLGSCSEGTGGGDVWHLLDLTSMQAPVDVVAVLDASFDAALDLREGPCGDTLSRDCNRAGALREPSSAIVARLEPGAYWLVVDGHTRESRGDFDLKIEIDARHGSCAGGTVTSTCERPLSLDTRRNTTVLLDVSCPSAEEIALEAEDEDTERTFYFELDLREESAQVVASIAAWGWSERRVSVVGVYRAGEQQTDCNTPIAESYIGNGLSQRIDAELSTVLEPDRYVIEVATDRLDFAGAASPVALSVALDRQRCERGPLANTCGTAFELDPSSGVQVVSGDTSCNSNHLTLDLCETSEAPEQFYRLDLSAQSGPMRARMALRVQGITFSPLLYLLASGSGDACGDGLYCYDSLGQFEGLPVYELTLAPAVYFIGVDGSEPGAAGRYELFLELEPTSPRRCVDAQMLECQFHDFLVDCCLEPENAGCARSLELCGLAPETTACVCSMNPACCGEEGNREGCTPLFAACGYLCPEFAPSEGTCALGFR